MVKAQKSVKVAAVAAAASAPTVLAASQAVAHDALFTVAELGDTIDEETALFVLVGGSLALVTAVLSLVIGAPLTLSFPGPSPHSPSNPHHAQHPRPRPHLKQPSPSAPRPSPSRLHPLSLNAQLHTFSIGSNQFIKNFSNK